METRRRRARNGRSHDRDEALEAIPHLRLKRLRRSFAKFRREHMPRTRIPHELRSEALAALQNGAPELEVRRACGVTAYQLEQWRKKQDALGETCDLEVQEARVFPIVDKMSVMSIDPARDHVQQGLELRVGRWAICIRQIKE